MEASKQRFEPRGQNLTKASPLWPSYVMNYVAH